MSEAQQIITRFSMYASFQDSYKVNGITLVSESNRILKSLIEYLIESDSNQNSDDWARLFLKGLIEARPTSYFLLKVDFLNPTLSVLLVYWEFSQSFLFSYLQLVCWQAARKTSNDLRVSPNVHVNYSFEDCFILATEISLIPEKLLKNFDFDSNFSLEGYARTILARKIKNQVVKELGSRSVKFSDNGLLRYITKKKLEQALIEYGISQTELIFYFLAWQSFKELFEVFYPANNSTGTRKDSTQPLREEQLSQIASRYNQQLQRLAIKDKAINTKEINRLLNIVVKAIRLFENKKLISLEEYRTTTKRDITNLEIDCNLPNVPENQEEFARIRQVIQQELQTLEAKSRSALLLWLGLEINQADFLSFLQLKQQYQVSREFKRYLKSILKAAIECYLSENPSQKLSESEVNQLCSNQLNEIKEYLEVYSKSLLNEVLFSIMMQQISIEEKSYLTQYCQQRTDSTLIEQKYNDSSGSLLNSSTEVLKIQEKLQQLFRHAIEERLKISLKQFDFNSIEAKISDFIEKWLRENQAKLFLTQM